MKYITPDKIMYHPEVLAEWHKGGTPAPVNFEIHLTDRCCNKCYYCSAWEAKKGAKEMKHMQALSCINFIRHVGAKAVTFSGGGEPFMHPNAVELIKHASHIGLDVGVITNGVKVTKEVSKELLKIKNLKWIRFSFDAITTEQYREIRGTNDFELVKQNIKDMLELKTTDVTIGVQNVVNKYNYANIDEFTKMCKKEFPKIDYIQVRPIEVKLGEHPYTPEQLKEIKPMLSLSEALGAMISDKWDLIFGKREFGFSKCWCSNIIPTINSEGNVYICCHMNRVPEYLIGNVKEMVGPDSFFENIKETISKLPNLGLNPGICPTGCRGSNINRMMEGIKKGHPHQNFL